MIRSTHKNNRYPWYTLQKPGDYFVERFKDLHHMKILVQGKNNTHAKTDGMQWQATQHGKHVKVTRVKDI